MIDIGKATQGKWQAILPAVGIDKKFLTNRHGPCPLCGGKDRFRFDDKGRGMWFCSQCGAGDGIKLTMLANGYDFKQAARELEKHVGLAPVIPIRQGPSVQQVKDQINTIWKEAIPLGDLLPARTWWMRRAGYVPDFKDLRGVRNLTLGGRETYPGMVAMVRGQDGKCVNMHRTFLRNDGHKADMQDVRRVMALDLPDGCAIRLGAYTDVLGIAEGIETAVSVSAMFGIPCWAAINAQNLKKWFPPEGVRVVVFGDNDLSWTGQEAAYSLAKKLHAKKIEVDVKVSPDLDSDWNDVHMLNLAAIAE